MQKKKKSLEIFKINKFNGFLLKHTQILNGVESRRILF